MLGACMQPLHPRLCSLRLQPASPRRWPTYGWATYAPMCCKPSSSKAFQKARMFPVIVPTASHGPQALCHRVQPLPAQSKRVETSEPRALPSSCTACSLSMPLLCRTPCQAILQMTGEQMQAWLHDPHLGCDQVPFCTQWP